MIDTFRALGEGEVMDLYMGSAMAPESMAPDHWWRMGEGDNFPTITDYGSLNSPGTVQKGIPSDLEAVTAEQAAGGEGSANVLYSVTAQKTGVHSATLTSDYGATLYVVADCEAPSGSCQGMDMTMGPGESQVTWTANQGASYTIVVDGTNGEEGTYKLTVEAF